MRPHYAKSKAEDPIVAILREAYEQVPRLEDRTAYCMARYRAFLRNEHREPEGEDPVLARLCGEDIRL
jgi:hypothetical protein